MKSLEATLPFLNFVIFAFFVDYDHDDDDIYEDDFDNKGKDNHNEEKPKERWPLKIHKNISTKINHDQQEVWHQ